ncbi:uncharacterized protein LOC118645386 [Monomorium pharaonis]|uniref:uncharacterized protein LOC118645386 n=1 Tax=Monomorium pharaonis TaxID=307658 RepID=UPI001745D9BC|nr:uncharacterized protein LOC118645386 [Monomorium pharaonis]
MISPRYASFYESGVWYENRILNKGLPQGSILSPFLFNLYVKDILWNIPYNCQTLQFADDIAVVCSDFDTERIKSSLSSAFDKVHTWLRSIGLDISVPKTQCMILNRKKISPNSDGQSLEPSGLKLQKEVKYLGIVLDESLRWSNHINALKVKATRYVNVLKWIAGPSWGIKPKQCINFVNATVGAQIEWGSLWYINAARTHVKTIKKILCQAYKIALGIPKTIPNRVCWNFVKQRSLLGRISIKTDRYISKQIQLRNNMVINKIKNFYILSRSKKIVKRNIPFVVDRWDQIKVIEKHLFKWEVHPAFHYPFNQSLEELDLDLRSGAMALLCDNPDNAFKNLIDFNKVNVNEITIYTDGSRTEIETGITMVGCSVYVPHQNLTLKYKLNDLTSSFTAESVALLKAIELAQRNNWSYINICTDSKSNLDIINSPADVNKNTIKKLNPWVEDIRQRINEAEGVGSKIRFTWCPAHKNISGNEIADNAAKDGALIGEPIDNKIAFSEALASLRSNYNQMKEDYMESINIGTGNYYMYNFSDVNIAKVAKYKLDRKELCLLIRIITGYPFTNSVKFKFGLVDSPECNCGELIQNLNHILWACPLYNEARNTLYSKLFNYKCYAPFTIESLISMISERIAKAVIKYILEIDLKL